MSYTISIYVRIMSVILSGMIGKGDVLVKNQHLCYTRIIVGILCQSVFSVFDLEKFRWKRDGRMEINMKRTDVVIIGTGAAGLYCALHIPEEINVLMITKEAFDQSDSFLAQGGMCMLRDEEDYEGYFEDTMRAGHYENDKKSVEVMIRSSQDVAKELLAYGVDFNRENGKLVFTREGGHSRPRILFHEDVTGKEITGTLYEKAKYTVFACGGLGGLYRHSTNFRHITGDALAIAKKHAITLEHVDYIQIHPTTLYSEKPGRRFLISESVRGEGAILLNKKKERFCNELLPRDVVTAEIKKQMAADNMPYVWLSMERIPKEEIETHFPNILQRCLEEGYDPTKECIPVVPAQHYFMGGIKVDLSSKTSMNRLYAVGEISCNGVHGKNRLASNSLLESMVFAKRAAQAICGEIKTVTFDDTIKEADAASYANIEKLKEEYKKLVLDEIEREKQSH